jgi:hypothetical protein
VGGALGRRVHRRPTRHRLNSTIAETGPDQEPRPWKSWADQRSQAAHHPHDDQLLQATASAKPIHGLRLSDVASQGSFRHAAMRLQKSALGPGHNVGH